MDYSLPPVAAIQFQQFPPYTLGNLSARSPSTFPQFRLLRTNLGNTEARPSELKLVGARFNLIDGEHPDRQVMNLDRLVSIPTVSLLVLNEMMDIVTGKQIGRASCRERVLRLV